MKIINPRYVFPFWIRIPFWIWRKLSIFAGSNGVPCDVQYFDSRLLICVSPFLADFLGRAGWKSTSMMCRNTLLRKTYFQNKCFHSEINLRTSRRTFEKKNWIALWVYMWTNFSYYGDPYFICQIVLKC